MKTNIDFNIDSNYFFRLLIVLAAATLIEGCTQPSTSSTSSIVLESNSTNLPYKFGGIFQLSGPQTPYGTLAKNGMELAIEDINNAGGINGRRVTGIYEDSGGDRAKAATAAQKLISIDGIDALFTITPGMAGVVSPIAEENKIPYIYIGSVNVFALNKTYVFKDYPSPQDLCEILAKKAISLGHTKIALIGPNDEVTQYCKEGAERISPLLSFETFLPGDVDIKTQLTKIQNSNPTALILYALAGDCGNALRQIKDLGLSVQLFLPVQSFACGNQENSNAFADQMKTAFGSDIALDETSTDPRLVSFMNRLEERGKVINLKGSALEYDILMEMAHAYSGCSDRECVINNLHTLHVEGLTGNISYRDQIVVRDVMLTTYAEGKWVAQK